MAGSLEQGHVLGHWLGDQKQTGPAGPKDRSSVPGLLAALNIVSALGGLAGNVNAMAAARKHAV